MAKFDYVEELDTYVYKDLVDYVLATHDRANYFHNCYMEVVGGNVVLDEFILIN